MNILNLIKSTNHNDSIETYSDGIKYLIESKSDIVSYNTQKNLTLFNVAVLEVDKKGNYIYEYILERQADIIENIYIISSNDNIKMTFIIGGEEYDYINTFIPILSQYHEFKLKFIFSEKPTMDDKISIYYKNYLIKSDLRKELIITKGKTRTDTNIYTDGMCIRI